MTYLPDKQGIRTSLTDYNYGYGRALADGVVRPVMFMVYAGHMRWKTQAGDEMEARLGEGNTKDITSQAWRTALDPKGEWIPQVLQAADRRLSEVRHGIPDAGGLVIATDQTAARAYAAILKEITGESPTVVLSDEKESSDRIDAFSAGDSRWMVAVRMVSEGVDVPRLAVGVYATSASTPLFFAQAIGRFVRARRRGETASVFLPNVPSLMALADPARARTRPRPRPEERRGGRGGHVEPRGRDGGRGQPRVEGVRRAHRRVRLRGHVVVSDLRPGGLRRRPSSASTPSPAPTRNWTSSVFPACSNPTRCTNCSRSARHARRSGRRRGRPRSPPAEKSADVPPPLYRTLKEQRSLLNSLVGPLRQDDGGAPRPRACGTTADVRRARPCSRPA